MQKVMSLLIALLLSYQFGLGNAGEDMHRSINIVHQIFSHDRVLEHHHHHDASAHFEAGTNEINHQHSTDHSHTTDLVSLVAAIESFPTLSINFTNEKDSHASVYLEGLLRPPRSLLSVAG